MIDIVNKSWDFCNYLRHDGITYGDYIEQLTYLLFLKMVQEKDITMPRGCSWIIYTIFRELVLRRIFKDPSNFSKRKRYVR